MFQIGSGPRRVLVLGEVLCDLFAPEAGQPLALAPALVPRIGGAPANVAVQLARLEVPVQLLTAVGGDPLGERVLRLLEAEGVGLSFARRLPDRKTGICLVEVDAAGERQFHPWREKSAELAYGPGCLDEEAFRGAAVLHRGTVGLRAAASRAALQKALRLAKKAGALSSLDVNLRFRMFASREVLLQGARAQVALSDVVKATDEEARALYGDAPVEELAARMLEEGAALVALTLGAEGALLASRACRVRVGSPVVPVVDATGAGDAFMGALLAQIVLRGLDRRGLEELAGGALEDMGARACAAGARVVTALGATTAMPRRRELFDEEPAL